MFLGDIKIKSLKNSDVMKTEAGKNLIKFWDLSIFQNYKLYLNSSVCLPKFSILWCDTIHELWENQISQIDLHNKLLANSKYVCKNINQKCDINTNFTYDLVVLAMAVFLPRKIRSFQLSKLTLLSYHILKRSFVF